MLASCACAGLTALYGFAAATGARAEKASAGASVDLEMRMMDTNGDHKISADEHAAGARKMFETMDSSKDGKVTAAEMDAAQPQVTGRKASKHKLSAAEKIKVVDTNKDGILSAEEHEAGSTMVFGKMDADQDGFLTKAELEAGHAKMMSKPARAGKPINKP
jgi:hypothetical protein